MYNLCIEFLTGQIIGKCSFWVYTFIRWNKRCGTVVSKEPGPTDATVYTRRMESPVNVRSYDVLLASPDRKKNLSLECVMKVLWYFETSGTTHLTTQRHIPEHLNSLYHNSISICLLTTVPVPLPDLTFVSNETSMAVSIRYRQLMYLAGHIARHFNNRYISLWFVRTSEVIQSPSVD